MATKWMDNNFGEIGKGMMAVVQPDTTATITRPTSTLRNIGKDKEYWMFMLFNLIIGFALGLVEGLLGIAPGIDGSILATIYQLAILIPAIAVGVRPAPRAIAAPLTTSGEYGTIWQQTG